MLCIVQDAHVMRFGEPELSRPREDDPPTPTANLLSCFAHLQASVQSNDSSVHDVTSVRLRSTAIDYLLSDEASDPPRCIASLLHMCHTVILCYSYEWLPKVDGARQRLSETSVYSVRNPLHRTSTQCGVI